MNKEAVKERNNGLLLEMVIKNVVTNNITKKVKRISTTGNEANQLSGILLTFEDDKIINLGIEYDANGDITKIGDVVISYK